MKKTVLITGASQGFGYEFAKRFAKDGYDLILVARNKEALVKVAEELNNNYKVNVTVLVKDLAKPSSPNEIASEVKKLKTGIDVLVNNAGFATHGKFSDLDLQLELDELQVNIVSLTHLTKLFLPDMLSRGNGKILNVASTAAYLPGPFMAVYYASKAYVLSFSEAIADEVRGSGVSVTVLCPGPTSDTGFSKRAGVSSSLLFTQSHGSTASVVDAGYRGLMENKTVIVPGLQNMMITKFARLVPRNVSSRLVKRMQNVG